MEEKQEYPLSTSLPFILDTSATYKLSQKEKAALLWHLFRQRVVDSILVEGSILMLTVVKSFTLPTFWVQTLHPVPSEQWFITKCSIQSNQKEMDQIHEKNLCIPSCSFIFFFSFSEVLILDAHAVSIHFALSISWVNVVVSMDEGQHL